MKSTGRNGNNITNITIFFSQMVILCCIVLLIAGCSGNAGKDLEAGFLDPPESAKPRVWWHWMNGNVTKEGIKADFEWMKRVGIGGFQNFDAGLASPQIVEKRLVYMTPEWKDAFRFTTRLADSLGLEMAIAGSPGWSESGGPWVTPEQAMKKYVWSETEVEGGLPFKGVVPAPPTATGIFQDLTEQSGFGSSRGPDDPPFPEYYTDAKLIAYKIPANDVSMRDLNPVITSSSGQLEFDKLTDGRFADPLVLPSARPGQKAWIRYEFTQPVTIQSMTIAFRESGRGSFMGFGGPGQSNRTLEISDDGRNFKPVFDIPSPGMLPRTYNFDPVTARFFRTAFLTPATQTGRSTMPPVPGGNIPGAGGQGFQQPSGTNISELVLGTVPKVYRFEEKAAFTTSTDLYAFQTKPVPAGDAVKKSDVIDLTGKMRPDGTLDWTPPEGKWRIMRIGYTLTGHENSPASPEATGFEVDKLSARHVRAYFENYLNQYKDATGGLMGKRGLQYIITDSWEAGVQNWTDSMMIEFKDLRGYDMLPWLPVLAGRIVESAEASDRFLWDFRKTIGDLTTKNHYNLLTKILKEWNMGRYTESHEGGRAFIGDGMEVKSKADIPMSATWTPNTTNQDDNGEVAVRYRADVRESASVAHIYGQNLVAAESMTARGNTWAFSPERLKPTADMEIAMGLNRFVIHTSVHQPVNDKIPGLGLGPYGQWFTRHETWAELAGPWITYLARNSFMLQQGKYAADVLYYYGEDNNITALFGNKLPDIPDSYSYDFVNADAIVNALSVKNGLIITPGGTTYRLLAMHDNSRYMTLPVLKKIRDLVEKGAVISGPRPVATPSLSDNQAEFESLVNELWPSETGMKSTGPGKTYSGYTVAEVLNDMKIAPDFEYSRPKTDTYLLFVHRTLPGVDIYWVNNRNNRPENVEATFRITGRAPEIWDPVTGTMEDVSYSIENNTTKVPLALKPNDAIFVVFRKKARSEFLILPAAREELLAGVEGPWEIEFQPDRGAPASIRVENLTSWAENEDPGIRFFSGTATYTKNIRAPQEWFTGKSELWIDLGSVRNLADIKINGKALGILWKKPFRMNITEAFKPGENVIEIKVTNLWVNRLIGDQQPDAEKKYTYTTQAFYRADSPLMESGLLGPVNIFKLTKE